MSFMNKRKREAPEPETKKTKAFVGERERELYSLLEEWPVYNHPEGGTVKITPWGSLRQYIDQNTGETVTKFEDCSFSELTFPTQQYELPSTPMSLNMSTSLRSSPMPEKLFSPSSEAEQYVVDGYRDGAAAGQSGHQQFCQEQEHYFGMMEQEEYENSNDSMVM